MEGGVGRIQRDCPSDVLDGNRMPAHLVGHESEQVPGVGMIRLGRENLPVNLLGSLQPAGLMVLDRNRQRFGNRRHNRFLGSPEEYIGEIP
jgi:hypothetical protein